MTGAIGDSAALATLADIELPAPPEWRLPVLLALALLLLVAAIIGIRFARRAPARGVGRSKPPVVAPRTQALERLAALERSWTFGEIDDREAGFRLCAVLRLGLGLAQVDATHPPAAVDPAQWQGFVDQLRQTRYRPGPRPLAAALFEQARAWLATPSPEAAGV